MKLEAVVVAGRNRAPLFELRPEPFHVVAIGVDPLRAGDLVLVALGRDRRSRAQGPDVLAKGVTAQAAVRHHPLRHPRQALQASTPGKRSRSGTACGSSCAWPGARMKATARPSPSAITHARSRTPWSHTRL